MRYYLLEDCMDNKFILNLKKQQKKPHHFRDNGILVRQLF